MTEKTNKGNETKKWIMQCSKNLFYENGYKATTTRLIASKANINLGLFNYYFKGKIEIGATIYYDVRNAFNEKIRENIPDLNDIDLFIISSAVELHLCLTDKNFAQFYLDISNEPSIFEKTQAFIIETFKKHYSGNNISNYSLFAGLSISSIKPSLVRHSLDTHFDIDECILYYMKQQLHYLGISEASSYKYLYILNKFDISTDENFNAVFIPKSN